MIDDVKAAAANRGGEKPAPVVEMPAEFSHPAVVGEGAPADKGDQSTGAPLVESKPAAKVRIGDKEFASTEEAVAYANDLVAARSVDDAYQAGLAAGQPQSEPAASPEEKIYAAVETEIFDNPKEAIKKIVALAKESTKNEIKQADDRVKNEKAMWDGFYEKNKDLSDFQELVKNHTYNNLNKYGHLSPETALQKIGDEVRGMLKLRDEAAKPRTELSERSTQTAKSGGSPVASAQKEVQKGLDFVSQLKQARNRELPKQR